MSEENRNNDPLAHQKEVLKSAIKKIVDATVDIGVELYFNSKDTNTTGVSGECFSSAINALLISPNALKDSTIFIKST